MKICFLFLSLLLATNSAFADETSAFSHSTNTTSANLHNVLANNSNENAVQSVLTKDTKAFDENSFQSKSTQGSVSNETNTLTTNTQNPLTAESSDNAFTRLDCALILHANTA